MKPVSLRVLMDKRSKNTFMQLQEQENVPSQCFSEGFNNPPSSSRYIHLTYELTNVEAGIVDVNYSDTLISLIPHMPMDEPMEEPMDLDNDGKMSEEGSEQDIDLRMSEAIPHHADQSFPNEICK